MAIHEREIVTDASGSAGDAASGLFVPDLLLATQLPTARHPDSPCRRLVGAVLERALLDAIGPTARGPERDDALAWFQSEDEAPFSFRWIASQLGIDIDWLRARVRQRADAHGRAAPTAASATSLLDTKTRRAA